MTDSNIELVTRFCAAWSEPTLDVPKVLDFFTDELKRTYLPKMVDGSWSGTMCLTQSEDRIRSRHSRPMR